MKDFVVRLPMVTWLLPLRLVSWQAVPVTPPHHPVTPPQQAAQVPARLASLALGQLEAGFACPRRLARLLDPELTPARGKDPSFRLPGALNDALLTAHRLAEDRETTVTNTLDSTPPDHLGAEEAQLFRVAVEHYDEAFGDDPAKLDRRSGEFLKRAAAGSRFELSGKLDLIFEPSRSPQNHKQNHKQNHDQHQDQDHDHDHDHDQHQDQNQNQNNSASGNGLLTVRRLVLREHIVTRSVSPSWRDIGTAALLRVHRSGDDGNQPILRIETLWAAGQATIITTYVRVGDLDALRERLFTAVDAATKTPESAVPGWWCPTCRFAHRCPAIPQDSAEQLLSRFDQQ